MKRLALLACLNCLLTLPALQYPAAAQFSTPVAPPAPTATPPMSREDVVRTIEERIRERSRIELERQKRPPQGQRQIPGAPGAMPQPVPAPGLQQPQANSGQSGTAAMPTSGEVVLLIDPPSATAHVGEPMLTTVTAVCLQQREFDSVDVRLSYDPSKLKPTAVHYNELKDLIDGEPQFAVKPAAGQIHFAAKLRSPLAFTSKKLISIVWTPLRESEDASVKLSWPDQRSTLQLGHKDLLSGNQLEKASLLPLDVLIKKPARGAKKSQGQEIFEQPSIWLDVDGPLGPFATDEEFRVNIHLRNPQRTGFDSVSLVFDYDPQKIRVLDWDTGNWIRTGANIHDGSHKVFPFNVFRRNEVNQQAGRIVYQMGTDGVKLDGEGLLAQIRAQAISPEASVEDFSLVFEVEEGPVTEISGGGIPLLGKVD